MSFFSTYQQLSRYLDSLSNRGISPSLDSIKALSKALEFPERQFRAVQVVGTNGKTTTARAIGLLLAASGLKAGVYTSPHLISYYERYELNSETVSGEKLVPVANTVKKAQAKVEVECNRSITQFEFLTALALVLFAQEQVDVAVLEAGMGAKWDATSVTFAEVGVLTNVSYDHLDFLGPTLADIAKEKAYVIREGNQVVMGEVEPELKPIFSKRAEQEKSKLFWENKDFTFKTKELTFKSSKQLVVKGVYDSYNFPFNLKGDWQVSNIAKAVVAAELFLKKPLSQKAVMALINFQTPGRAEELVIGQTKVVLDGAHNVAGIKSLLSWLNSYQQKKIFVVSIMADKQVKEMLKLLLNDVQTEKLIFTRCATSRAVNPEKLNYLKKEEKVIVEPDFKQALKLAVSLAGADKLVVVSGSLGTYFSYFS